MKKKILIVDDDQYIRNSLSAILNNAGYVTKVAEDKKSSFFQLTNEKPDLILMDVHISTNQEGYEIAQELSKDKKYKNIPIIILSSTEIISGGDKLVNLARKFRSNPQFSYINAILQENEDGTKSLEYKAESNGEILKLAVYDAISKPIDNHLLLESIESFFEK